MQILLNDIHVQLIVGNIQIPTRVDLKDRNPTARLRYASTGYPHTDLQPVAYYKAQPQTLWQKLWNVTTYTLIHIEATDYVFKGSLTSEDVKALKEDGWSKSFDCYRIFDKQPIHKLCEHIEE